MLCLVSTCFISNALNQLPLLDLLGNAINLLFIFFLFTGS
jgi:hypothetical protein